MTGGDEMDMKWKDMVTAAAKGSVSKGEKDGKYVDLSSPELRALVQLILSLPQQDQELLFGKNCFHLPMETIEEIYGIQDAETTYAACRKLLSVCVGCREGEWISERTLQEACRLAVHEYVRQEFVPRKKKLFRTAMMIAAAMLLSSVIVFGNDYRVRDKMLTSMSEYFEVYPSPYFKKDPDAVQDKLKSYEIAHLPRRMSQSGFLEGEGYILYLFTSGKGEECYVLISDPEETWIFLSNKTVKYEDYFIGGKCLLLCDMDNASLIKFSMDNVKFIVYGTLDKNEMIKIANGVRQSRR